MVSGEGRNWLPRGKVGLAAKEKEIYIFTKLPDKVESFKIASFYRVFNSMGCTCESLFGFSPKLWSIPFQPNVGCICKGLISECSVWVACF